MLSFSNEVDPFFSATHIYFSNTNLVLFFWLWGGGGVVVVVVGGRLTCEPTYAQVDVMLVMHIKILKQS